MVLQVLNKEIDFLLWPPGSSLADTAKNVVGQFCCNTMLLIHVHDSEAQLYIEKLKDCAYGCPSLIRISQNGSASDSSFMNLVSRSPWTCLWGATAIPPDRGLCLLGWWSTGHMNTNYYFKKLGNLLWEEYRDSSEIMPLWMIYVKSVSKFMILTVDSLSSTNDQEWLSLKG